MKATMNFDGVPKTWVRASGKWVDLNDTITLNIAQDIYDRDVITFEYEGEVCESISVNSYSKPQ